MPPSTNTPSSRWCVCFWPFCCIRLLTSQDTEFPGIVARPIGSFKTGSDYHYQTMRCNVDMLKIIQLGVTLCDEDGHSPEGMTWQFNFQFNLK